MEKTREIKFRAWHTGLKQMFSAEEMSSDQLALLPDGRFCNVHGSDTSKSTFPPMIPLQYTSLKDKNGKEIYHLDGVTVWTKPTERHKYNGVVVWKDGCWHVKFDNNFPFRTELFLWTNIEVIGNIYENPDLL